MYQLTHLTFADNRSHPYHLQAGNYVKTNNDITCHQKLPVKKHSITTENPSHLGTTKHSEVLTYAINSKTGEQQWSSGTRNVHMYSAKASEERRREGL